MILMETQAKIRNRLNSTRCVNTIRIVLGEDHILMRHGLRNVLAQYPDFRVIGEAGDGQQVLDLVESLSPDIVLLDIRMPVLSGIEVVRTMKERSLGTRALILSAYDDDIYVSHLMQAGAAGYMLKSAGADELADAIRRVHSGQIVLDPAIELKVLNIWKGNPDAPAGHKEELTPREKDVLGLAANGFRNKDIGEKLGISVRTVECHFNNILGKLGVTSRTAAVVHALSHDLARPGPDSK